MFDPQLHFEYLFLSLAEYIKLLVMIRPFSFGHFIYRFRRVTYILSLFCISIIQKKQKPQEKQIRFALNRAILQEGRCEEKKRGDQGAHEKRQRFR